MESVDPSVNVRVAAASVELEADTVKLPYKIVDFCTSNATEISFQNKQQ
jgi:hypothetical protein